MLPLHLPDTVDLSALPTPVARSADKLLAAATPGDQHAAALDLSNTLLTWLARVLASEYQAHRATHGEVTTVEQALQELHSERAGKGPWTLGRQWALADTIRRGMNDKGVLAEVRWGRDGARTACRDLVSAWLAIKQ